MDDPGASHASAALARRAFLARMLAAAGGLLAACQQPISPPRSADPRPTDLRTPEPKPTPTLSVAGLATPVLWPPKPGGSLVGAAEADPADLDPHTTAAFASLQAWGDLTYQSLVMFDANMKIVPCLAEAWRVS